jgi:hypothetical protein
MRRVDCVRMDRVIEKLLDFALPRALVNSSVRRRCRCRSEWRWQSARCADRGPHHPRRRHDDVQSDDVVSAYAGMGGQGVLPIPLVYNGWVQKLPNAWKNY